MPTNFARRTVNKTADYTVRAAKDRSGTVFTNRGATAGITFTLPKPTKELLGDSYRFLGIADFSITVAAPTADTLIAKNDLTADSLAASTGGALIGALMEAFCVESAANTFKWVLVGLAVNHTYTVAT